MPLQLITNRGSKVWPGGWPETFAIDQWRCRFLGNDGAAITHEQIIKLLQRLAGAGFDFIKTESLFNFDGSPGYSSGGAD